MRAVFPFQTFAGVTAVSRRCPSVNSTCGVEGLTAKDPSLSYIRTLAQFVFKLMLLKHFLKAKCVFELMFCKENNQKLVHC